MYQSYTKLRSLVITRKVRRTFISFHKITIILDLMVSSDENWVICIPSIGSITTGVGSIVNIVWTSKSRTARQTTRNKNNKRY